MSAAGNQGAEEVIRLARERNPDLRVMARTMHLRERDALRQAGVDSAFSGEGEVALTMTESVLREIGTTS